MIIFNDCSCSIKLSKKILGKKRPYSRSCDPSSPDIEPKKKKIDHNKEKLGYISTSTNKKQKNKIVSFDQIEII